MMNLSTVIQRISHPIEMLAELRKHSHSVKIGDRVGCTNYENAFKFHQQRSNWLKSQTHLEWRVTLSRA